MASSFARRRNARPQRVSHFELEVPLQVLNPDPPVRSNVTEGFRYLDVKIPEAGGPERRRTEQPRRTNAVPNEEVWIRRRKGPTMSLETRRLLREVENIKQRGYHRPASPQISQSDKENDDDCSTLRDVSSSRLQTVSSTSKPSASSRTVSSETSTRSSRRRRQVVDISERVSEEIPLPVKRRSPSPEPVHQKPKLRRLNLVEAAVQTDFELEAAKKSVNFQTRRSRQAKKERVDDLQSAGSRSQSAEDAARRVREYKRKQRSKSAGAEEERKREQAKKRELRESRSNLKPWRDNMCKTQPKKANTNDNALKQDDKEEEEEKSEDTLKKKPWRANMTKKKPIEAQAKEEVTKAKVKAPDPALQKYIQQKRQAKEQEEKLKQEENQKLKESIQKRLLKLESDRRKRDKKVTPSANGRRKETGQKKVTLSTPDTNEEAFLRQKLEDLSRQMKQQMKLDQQPPTKTLSPEAKSNEKKPQGESKAKANDSKKQLETKSIDRSPRSTSGIIDNVPVRDSSAKRLQGQDKERKMVSEVFAKATAGGSKGNHHQPATEALRKMLKQRFEQPRPVPVRSQQRTSGDDHRRLLLSETEEDEALPPQIHYAERTARTDQYNFASSLRRKMAEMRVASPEEETPRSTTQYSERLPSSKAQSSESRSKGASIVPDATEQKSISSESRAQSKAGNEQHAKSNGSMAMPDALRLRFMAEMNQLDAMQEAESQLDQMRLMRDVTAAKIQRNTLENYEKETEKSAKDALKSFRKSESRAQFEQRLRCEFQNIMANKMQKLLAQQTEATRVTADAAYQLAKLQLSKRDRKSKQSSSSSRSKSSNTYSTTTEASSSNRDSSTKGKEIKEPLRSMMTKTNSNISDVLSAIQRTEKEHLPRTISDAIETLESSERTNLMSRTVSEEIAVELQTTQEDYSSKFEDESTIKEEAFDESPANTETIESETFTASSSRRKTIEEESASAKQQYTKLKKQESALIERVRQELSKLEGQKRQMKEKGKMKDEDDKRLSSIKKKERAILLELKTQRKEIEQKKERIKEEERERKIILKKQKALQKKSPTDSSSKEDVSNSSKTIATVTPSLEVDTSSIVAEDIQQVEEDEEEESRSVSTSKQAEISSANIITSPSKMESLKKTLGTTLKTPLSPKSSVSGGRRRHSSADSDESFSHSETVSEEHSDVEIRVNTLKDELKRRMMTAAKLKRQQRSKSKEKMRLQEDALKKQIEKYDRLIQDTKQELEVDDPSVVVIPPQIKTPKQAVAEKNKASVARKITSPDTSQDNEMPSCDSSATDTIITSPKVVSVAQAEVPSTISSPAAVISSKSIPESIPVVLNDSRESAPDSNHSDLNYSDDFTSSAASLTSEATEQAKKEEPLDVKVAEEQRAAKNEEVPTVSEREALGERITTEIFQNLVQDVCTELKSLREEKTPSAPSPKPKKKEALPKRLGKARPQDLMLTTFDISSESSGEDAVKDLDKPKESGPDLDDDVDDGLSRDFMYDDDFGSPSLGKESNDDLGLSRIRQEAEEIRKRELLIAQEIERIQQESSSKRTIPNKPPPPYTPPSSPSSNAASSVKTISKPLEPPKYVPAKREEITKLVQPISEALFHSKSEEGPFDAKKLTESLSKPGESESHKLFVSFLVDLALEIYQDIFRCHSDLRRDTQSAVLPWKKSSQYSLARERHSLPKTASELCSRVEREALIALGFERRAQRENLVVRWSQKRRDRVDQILVRELHAEEESWKDYSKDELTVKDQLSEAIMAILIEDTVSEVKRLTAKE